MPTELQTLWGQLTPEHQTLLTQLLESLAALDVDLSQRGAPPRNAGAIALLDNWLAQDPPLTPAEAAAAEAEFADFKAALNANRVPEPPLFP